jgi:hypothetical protein
MTIEDFESKLLELIAKAQESGIPEGEIAAALSIQLMAMEEEQ